MSQRVSDEILTFQPGDPANPRNWSEWKKWSIVLVLIPLDLSVSWLASGFSPASMKFAEDMGVSTVVGTLGLSMTVLGFAFGPMFLAPLSEFYGRYPVYIAAYGVSLLFLLGTALVQNLGGFLAMRFLTGLFAGCTIGESFSVLTAHIRHSVRFSIVRQYWPFSDPDCITHKFKRMLPSLSQLPITPLSHNSHVMRTYVA